MTQTATIEQTSTIVREDDQRTHIEDTRLFWVFRNGRHVKLAWNELSSTERAQIEEAERRDYFNSDFDPNYAA